MVCDEWLPLMSEHSPDSALARASLSVGRLVVVCSMVDEERYQHDRGIEVIPFQSVALHVNIPLSHVVAETAVRIADDC